MKPISEEHLKSVLSAWTALANARAKEERVRNMSFELTPMSKPLLESLEGLVADCKDRTPENVFLELQEILKKHQEDFVTHGESKLYDRPAPPMRVFDYSKNKTRHSDPMSSEVTEYRGRFGR